MAQPPAYTITTDFSQDESNSVSGRSTVVTAALDSELANISSFISAMRTNIALIQADDGTIKDDAVDLPALASNVINYITTNGNGWYASDTGAVNAMVATLTPAPAALTNGMFIVSDIKLTNTSATVTMNVNGLGAKAVVTDGAGTTPSVGALTIGTFYGFQYDASADKFQVVFSGDSITHSASATASASAAASSATDADTAKLAAEAALDAFSDQYLGAFAFVSLPTVDNDGDPLTDGDLAYDTTNNVLMVYDLGTTTWLKTVPSASDQTSINTVNANITNINTVAGDSTSINTVSGLSGAIGTINANETNINTVSGISANVTTVAGVSANVTTVAGISANVTSVAGNETNVNIVATNVSDVNSFANIYRISATEPTTSLDQGDLYFNTTTNELRAYSTMWQATAPSAMVQASINIVAGDVVYSEDLGSVADALTTSSGNGDITTVADSIANVNTLAATAVIADMAILGTADVVNDMNVIEANITSVTTVSTSIADVNRYANEYTIAASAPGSPSVGDLWYDSTNNMLKYYTGSVFSALSPGIADVVSDTSPQLGNDLDGQNNNFTNCGTVSGANLQIDFGGIV